MAGPVSLVRRILAVGVLVLAAVVGAAAPASAHTLSGPQPTNFRTTVDGITPALPGVEVAIVDGGTKVQLANGTDSPVTVLGYEGEPYLRIGPRGVEENRRSPATALNRSATPSGRPPAGLDATAEPRWVRLSAEPVARWHDHRAHWMGRGSVRDLDWSIPLRRGPTGAEIRGTVTTEPAPRAWLWIATAVAITAVTVVAARGRRWAPVLAVALSLLTVSETLHVIGAWSAWEATVLRRLIGVAPSLVAIAACVGALVALALRRRSPDAATPLALLAGVFTALAGGLADLGSLTHAIPPSTLAPAVVRATVAVALGAGVGVAVIAARHLRPADAPVAPPARPVSG